MGRLLGSPPHPTPPHKGGLLSGRIRPPWAPPGVGQLRGSAMGWPGHAAVAESQCFSQVWIPASLRLPSSQTGHQSLPSVPTATGKRTPDAPVRAGVACVCGVSSGSPQPPVVRTSRPVTRGRASSLLLAPTLCPVTQLPSYPSWPIEVTVGGPRLTSG